MRLLAFARLPRERCYLISFLLPALLYTPAAIAHAGGASGLPPTLTRAEGRVSLRAIPLAGRVIHVDGRLDEDIYTQFEPASDFIQQEPKEGEPATERTEAWVFFDEKNVYVSARCLDSHPERMVASEMRRDHFNLSSRTKTSR